MQLNVDNRPNCSQLLEKINEFSVDKSLLTEDNKTYEEFQTVLKNKRMVFLKDFWIIKLMRKSYLQMNQESKAFVVSSYKFISNKFISYKIISYKIISNNSFHIKITSYKMVSWYIWLGQVRFRLVQVKLCQVRLGLDCELSLKYIIFINQVSFEK